VSSIPMYIQPRLYLPPPRLLDLPNAQITFLDRSLFNLPSKVPVEFRPYLALPWYGNGTAAGEMIK